ncbi:MAG TPA: prephenate dehydrogenase/arogenate dehydrogenase family protein, partial [Acidimicrobiales bacterium]
MTDASPARRANVVGLGLIGGSVAKALRARGWVVHGADTDPARVDRAIRTGVVDGGGIDRTSEITFVAVPVRGVAAAVQRSLQETAGLVTDVGSVKGPIVAEVDDARFVGGHPMAGSEQEGLDGADADMFEGAVWVLTPTASTSDAAFAAVAGVVASLGAEVVALPPDRHDALVAVVSHVPHLTAATLMTLADQRAEEHAALLRLAAGGFRDMTRIASGHPAIWPDICAQNRDAIVQSLDGLIGGLRSVRDVVAADDREGLLDLLQRARAARANLPSRVAARPADLSEVRVPVPDRPGAAAEVFTLAAELGVNVYDFEVFHS